MSGYNEYEGVVYLIEIARGTKFLTNWIRRNYSNLVYDFTKLTFVLKTYFKKKCK